MNFRALGEPAGWQLRQLLSAAKAVARTVIVWACVAMPLQAATTPLTRAIRVEDFEEAKKHIDKASVNQPDGGRYHPLTYAVYTGNVELVRSLLEAGAEPNTVEHNGRTALHLAARLAGLEIIPLLKGYGAEPSPTPEALSPVVGAVEGGSAESLKVLLDAFPRIDVTQGTIRVPKSRRFPDGPVIVSGVDQSRLGHLAPIYYALDRGYSDVALMLVNNGAGSPQVLKKAAGDARCSLALIEALVATGIDPRGGLSAAAAIGGLDKIKVMLRGVDVRGRESREKIEEAAYVAASYNHRETCEFLFGLLGRTLPSIDDWREEAPAGTARQAKPNAAAAATSMDLSTLLPRAGSAPDGAIAASGSIAIISPAALRNFAGLLTAQLSDADDITLVERDSIDNAIRESSLAALRSQDSDSFHQQLNLIPAEHVIVISEVGAPKDGLLQFALISTRSGVVSSLIVAPTKKASDLEELPKIASQLLAKIPDSAADVERTVAVSHLSVKASSTIGKSYQLANLANTLIPHHISNTPGCSLLRRTQLQHLETEKAIGVEGSYWASAWIVDGGLDLDAAGQVRLTLRATNPMDAREFQAIVSGSDNELGQIVSKGWEQLAQKINLKLSPERASPNAEEIAFFTQRADWLLQAGYYQEALDLSNTSIALGDTSLAVKLVHFNASRRTLPSIGNINADPYRLPRSRRYSIASEIGSFLDFASSAINCLEDPGIAKRPPKEISRMNFDLKWLIHFRCLIDDSIVEARFSDEIRSLDSRIRKFTALYLNKVHPYYGLQLLELGSKGPTSYFERRAPETLRMILGSSAKAARRSHRVGDPPLDGDSIARRIRDMSRSGIPIEPWIELLAVMEKSPQPQVRITAFHGLRALADTYPERMRLERELLQTIPEAIFDPAAMYFRPSEAPIDSILAEELVTNRAGLIDGFPRWGLAEVVIDQPENFPDTAEYLRLIGPYCWLQKALRYSDEDWETRIVRYRKDLLNPRSSHEIKIINPEDWLTLRDIAGRDRKLGAGALSQFNAMIPQGAEEVVLPAGKALALGQPLILPDLRIDSSDKISARVTDAKIVGDQLWIPVSSSSYDTSIDPGKYQRPESIRLSIQVLTIPTGKVHTIPLPDGVVVANNQMFNRSIFTRGFIVADDYVYYMLSSRSANISPTGDSRLISINRKTYEVNEIKLPLPKIGAITRNAVGNTIYVSIYGGVNRVLLNQVVAVNGRRITETLVMNRRIPAISPLDTPDVRITSFHSIPGNLRLFSSNEKGFATPLKVKTINYNPETKTWEKLPEGWGEKPRPEFWKWEEDRERMYREVFYQFKWMSHPGERYCFPAFGIGFSGELLIAPAAVMANFKQTEDNFMISKTPDPIVHRQYHYIPLNVSPVDSPAFDIKQNWRTAKSITSMRRLDDLRPAQAGNFSINDLIRDGSFNSYVIGSYKGQLLIALHNQIYTGFPAIWMVKESAVKEFLPK